MREAVIWSLLALIIGGCQEHYTPKPKAYARISLPDPKYLETNGESWQCPYRFEYSSQSAITLDPHYKDEECWYNIYYPNFRATLHLTYFDLENDLSRHIEESRKLAMKHLQKASQIEEVLINRPANRVHGIAYHFKGSTASDMQFFLTDSNDHFIRGSLYFSARPNKDSLAPIIAYVERDIEHLIATFNWLDER